MKKPTKDEETPTETAQATEQKQPEENLLETAEKELATEEATKEATTPETAPTTPTEETTKPKKTKEEEEEIVEEKTYTIPLGKALIMPPRKRAPRAMHMIRAYIIKHMKIPSRAEEDEEEPPQLTITNELNQRIWEQGIEKPPRKIRVRATKDKDGNVKVHLAEAD